MDYKLVITPAIEPALRHQIEDYLKEMGFEVYGGGQRVDMSSCDITFSDRENEEK